jgi:hypothetical protein
LDQQILPTTPANATAGIRAIREIRGFLASSSYSPETERLGCRHPNARQSVSVDRFAQGHHA